MCECERTHMHAHTINVIFLIGFRIRIKRAKMNYYDKQKTWFIVPARPFLPI